MTRVETAELGLGALDALEVEGLAVFVGPERPLQGLAGHADWRLGGFISRAIREGKFEPESGEVLLLPSAGCIAVPRIFCFGLPVPPGAADAFHRECLRVCEAMKRAGCASWAGALPEPPPGSDVTAGRAFLEALRAAPARKVILLGDARALHADLTAGRDALGALEIELATPVSRVEMPSRVTGAHRAGAAGP